MGKSKTKTKHFHEQLFEEELATIRYEQLVRNSHSRHADDESSTSSNSNSSSSGSSSASYSSSNLSRKNVQNQVYADPIEMITESLKLIETINSSNLRIHDLIRLGKRVLCFVPKLRELKSSNILTFPVHIRFLYNFLCDLRMEELPDCLIDYERERIAIMAGYNVRLLQLMGFFGLERLINPAARRLEDIKVKTMKSFNFLEPSFAIGLSK
jgi:hypothetical protein